MSSHLIAYVTLNQAGLKVTLYILSEILCSKTVAAKAESRVFLPHAPVAFRQLFVKSRGIAPKDAAFMVLARLLLLPLPWRRLGVTGRNMAFSPCTNDAS